MKFEKQLVELRPAITGFKALPYEVGQTPENPFKVVQNIQFDKNDFDFSNMDWLSKS